MLYKLTGNSKDFYNMYGDYSYLEIGYYISLDCELSKINVKPTTEEALDAYINPLAMQKAQLVGIKTPEYDIVTEKIIPPVLSYSINPFSSKCVIVASQEEVQAKLKTLTMSGKYAAICQKLPDDFRIDIVRCVLGHTLVKECHDFAMTIFEAFQLRLMKIRVIVTATDYLFSAIEPLLFEELTLKEKKIIEELGTWQK